MKRIEVVQGDITTQETDAIVNAANEAMLGGGGVDGAIHRAAGEKLVGECLIVPAGENNVRCPTGECRITLGYDLPSKYVIHTVGPIWQEDIDTQCHEYKLRASYSNCLAMANQQGLRSICFPCISTGVYHFPKDKAAEIAMLNAVAAFGDDAEEDWTCKTTLELIRFVCFDNENFEEYKKLLPHGYIETDHYFNLSPYGMHVKDFLEDYYETLELMK